MDYKEGLSEIKIMIKNRLNHSLSFARIGRNDLINDFEDWLSCLLTKIHLVESEITKTQQECDHTIVYNKNNVGIFSYCPNCGLKLR